MLQDERSADHRLALLAALEGWQRKLWTALPGIIQGPVAADGTVSVQPSVQGRFRTPAGVESNATLPLLIKCPLHFPGGGGFSLTFPVAHGDECLVVFASRCVDGWWQSGGVQPQLEHRMHDLSDGFAIAGFRSRPSALPSVSTSTVQLRSTDGTSYLELAAGGVINLVAPGGVKINGSLVATGEVSTDLNGGVHLSPHTHPVSGSETLAPNPGT